MDYYIRISIVFIILGAVVGYLIWFSKKDWKRIREREENNKALEDYLNTVESRAIMATSLDAIKLLWKETQASGDKYKYNQKNYTRLRELRSYMQGKFDYLTDTKI